jgi:hypothetical protein
VSARLFLALVTAVLLIRSPHTNCPARSELDAYAPSFTVSACGVGVTLSI